jgi:membrane-associated phospholipid phosphatase
MSSFTAVNGRGRRVVMVVALALLRLPGSATAQEIPPAQPTQAVQGDAEEKPDGGFFKTLFVNLRDDLKHIPRKNSLYWLTAGSGLALAVHQKDDEINAHLIGSSFADSFFKPGRYIGSFPFLPGSGIATYAIGKTGNHPRARHLGTDLIEATLLSEGITQGIKVMVRRDRPLLPDGTHGQGFSFPSGHASGIFAAATVLQQHLSWKAAVPTYLFASYVALSRLHDNRHFASDVVFGAVDGIIIGRSVTSHGRTFCGTPIVGAGTVGIMISVVP